jgi:imidazolonepropionase-like amidohydrolase
VEGNNRRDRRDVAWIICALVAVSGIAVALASAQTRPATQPAAVVTEYVKVDDAVIALSYIRVIDGTGQPARDNQTLIIRDGAIASIGDARSTPIPPGAKVLALPGYSVIPGLVGMHDHMFYPQPVNLAGQRKHSGNRSRHVEQYS